ncbi:MAG TPA: class I SAM-dependent methyltransferase [Bryobacteraceae bacterium]|jgi:SAM-dependent methyltransferase
MPAPNRPYRWLAGYYDQLFTFHIEWFERARQIILGRILPSVESACDLACGTGNAALRLARNGVRMTGVDLSPTMCRIAREKARRAGLPLRVIHADMRNFRLPGPVDLILCEFDALNHVSHKQDLVRVARAVSRALRPGGHFYFDVNNRLAFEVVWPGAWFTEQPGVALVMHGGYDRARDRGVSDCEWFLRKGRLWRRHHEHIEQVAWTAAEMRHTLRAAGFDRIRAFDAVPFFTGDSRIRPGCRTFYLARKAAR